MASKPSSAPAGRRAGREAPLLVDFDLLRSTRFSSTTAWAITSDGGTQDRLAAVPPWWCSTSTGCRRSRSATPGSWAGTWSVVPFAWLEQHLSRRSRRDPGRDPDPDRLRRDGQWVDASAVVRTERGRRGRLAPRPGAVRRRADRHRQPSGGAATVDASAPSVRLDRQGRRGDGRDGTPRRLDDRFAETADSVFANARSAETGTSRASSEFIPGRAVSSARPPAVRVTYAWTDQ